MKNLVCTLSADAAVRSRAPLGVSEHAMTGAWRVIVARTHSAARTYYFHENDDSRIAAALRTAAERFVEDAQ